MLLPFVSSFPGKAGEVGDIGEAISSGLHSLGAILGDSVSDSETAPFSLARASLPALLLRLLGEWERLREKAELRRILVLRGAAAATAARAATMLLESNAPLLLPLVMSRTGVETDTDAGAGSPIRLLGG